MSWREAAAELWPHALFGVAVCGALLAIAPALFVWSLPLTAGYLLAIPFAVVTANPSLGDFLRKYAIAAIPEDLAPPAEIAALQAREGSRHGL